SGSVATVSSAKRHSRERVGLRDPDQIVDRNPLIDCVLATRLRTVCDRGNLPVAPKTVAIVHEGLGANPERLPDERLIGGLKRLHQRITLIEIKSIADEMKLADKFRVRLALERAEQLLPGLLNFPARRVRQPAARPFEPALLRILVIDFAAVDLADKGAFA